MLVITSRFKIIFNYGSIKLVEERRAILKNMVLKFGKTVANLALLVTMINVNSTCLFIAYQPEIPEKANKLKKYS
jgi:cyclic lactone autoinducer peptide